MTPFTLRTCRPPCFPLFRVATLEDWTDIMYINMYGSDNYGYDGINVARTSSPSPLGAAIFFSSFVFIGTMVVLNLVIGVIMNSMDEMRKELQAELESRSRDESDAEKGIAGNQSTARGYQKKPCQPESAN